MATNIILFACIVAMSTGMAYAVAKTNERITGAEMDIRMWRDRFLGSLSDMKPDYKIVAKIVELELEGIFGKEAIDKAKAEHSEVKHAMEVLARYVNKKEEGK